MPHPLALLLGLAAQSPAPTLLPLAAPPSAADVPPPTLDLPPAPELVPFIDLPPPPTLLPDSVGKLVDAAFEADNDEAARAILRLARAAHPMARAQLDALERAYAHRRDTRLAQRERERIARLTAADWTDNWKGEIELGGARATGNTDTLALYGSVKLNREGLKWTHAFSARADVQQSDGRTIADRLRMGWQPGYKIRDDLFAYGLGQYERDRFLGFDHRLTASGGLGFTLVSNAEVKLDLLGGPALRHTFYTADGERLTAMARGSVAFRWQMTPDLKLTQDAALYLEGSKTNALSTSSLETKLLGRLKARLSYDLQYEKGGIAGRKPLDTTSRVTIAYGF